MNNFHEKLKQKFTFKSLNKNIHEILSISFCANSDRKCTSHTDNSHTHTYFPKVENYVQNVP